MKITSILRSKAFLVPVGLIVLVYLFLWAGLPRLVHWQAEKQVREKSGHVLSMERPQLNPFELTLRLQKLALATPEGEDLVKFDELFVDVSGTDLLTGLVALDQIDLKNPQVLVALLPEGKNSFTALIEAFKTDEPEEENQEPPALLLSHLLISNAVVDFQDRRSENGLKTRFEPLNLELRNISTRADQNGEFQLDALTGLDAALKLRANVQVAQPAAKGEVVLTGLNLDKLKPLLKPLLPTGTPTGFADLGLNFDFNMEAASANAQPRVVLNNMQAELRDFNLSAKPTGASPSAGFSSLKVSNGQFDLQAGKAELGSLVLTGLQLNHAGKSKAIGLQKIEVGPLAVDLAGQHAEVGSLKLEGGQVNVKRSPSGELDLLALVNAWAAGGNKADTTAEKAGKPWTYRLNTVKVANLNADIEDQGMKPALVLGLRNIALETGDISEDLDKDLALKASLAMQSGGTISIQGKLNPITTATRLNVDINSLAVKPAQPFLGQFAKLDLAGGMLSTQGQAIYTEKEQGYTGSLSVTGLRLNEAGTSKPFLQFKQLATPGLTATTKGLRIPRLTLDGLDTALLIAKDKSTNISRILTAGNTPAAADSNAANKPAASANPDTKAGDSRTAPPASPEFAVNIDRFNITNSELDFADESLFIPFGTRIHGLKGVVNGLSNRPGARGQLALSGTVDEFGEADAQGTLNLLDPTAFMNIAVKFNNVEMRSLTPYSGTFANRKIESGKLSMNLVYNIQDQQLNSSNQVTIDKLTLGERVESPQGRDLPLELAIAILEDSNGRIDLGLPITGNLNDPEFSYGAIVWKAIGNVLTKIVTAPFRALGALFGGSEEELGQVVFNPGANTLSPSQREGLKKLGEALGTRPNLGLTVQGTWAPADKVAIQNLQMRRAVAIQAGEKLGADEDPGPLAVDSPASQKAIEALFEKRLGSGELAALKAGFRKANPGQLEQGVAGKALGQVTKLFKDTRELSQPEVDALKGKNFHSVLAGKLQATEEVSKQQLEKLASQRLQVVMNGLQAAGVAPERLAAGKLQETKTAEDNTVPMGLEMISRK
ncbi:MAG TPA: DUF748 domain-containing protein [Limnobacter sp.]|nr:DUF748 domain-containing protein [Limnobacter sp.]